MAFFDALEEFIDASQSFAGILPCVFPSFLSSFNARFLPRRNTNLANVRNK